jgi:hypothetical protein
MPTYKTWILNNVPVKGGVIEVRVNVGPLGYGYGSAHPSQMISLNHASTRVANDTFPTGVVMSIGATKKSKSDTQGAIVVDTKTLTLVDRFDYTGYSNGVLVSENLEPSLSSLLEKIFYRSFGTLRVISASLFGSTTVTLRADSGTTQLVKGDFINFPGDPYVYQVASDVTVDTLGETVTLLSPLYMTQDGSVTPIQVNVTAAQYEVWFTRIPVGGSPEIYFAGDVDQDSITALHGILQNPHASNEQRRQQITLTINSIALRAKNKTIYDLRNDLEANPPSPPDLIEDDFYAGHLYHSGGTKRQATPFEPYPYANFTADGLFMQPAIFHPQYATARIDTSADAFPASMHGIRVTALLARIAKSLGFVDMSGNGQATLSGSFDYYLRAWYPYPYGSTPQANSSVQQSTPVRVHCTNHGYAENEVVLITGTGANFDGGMFNVHIVDANTFELAGTVNSGGGNTPHPGTSQRYDYSLMRDNAGNYKKFSASDIYVNFQFLFGYNPINGTHSMAWPCAWTDNMTLSDALRLVCNQFGCIPRITFDGSGNVTLVLQSLRQSPTGATFNTMLQKYLSKSKENTRAIGKNFVEVNNTADTGKIQCPRGTGDSISIELPWRAHRWGLWWDEMTFDPSLALQDQWHRFDVEISKNAGGLGGLAGGAMGVTGNPSNISTNHFLKALYGNGNPGVIDPDGWYMGTLLFVHATTSGLTLPIYPSSGGCTAAYTEEFGIPNTGGFYAVSYTLIFGAAPDETWPLSPNNYNTTVAAAQFFAQELLGDSIIVEREYGDCTDDAGNLATLELGVTASWYYKGKTRTFRMIDVEQDEHASTCKIQWAELPDSYTLLPSQTVSVTGETSASTGGSSGDPINTSSSSVGSATSSLTTPVRTFIPAMFGGWTSLNEIQSVPLWGNAVHQFRLEAVFVYANFTRGTFFRVSANPTNLTSDFIIEANSNGTSQDLTKWCLKMGTVNQVTFPAPSAGTAHMLIIEFDGTNAGTGAAQWLVSVDGNLQTLTNVSNNNAGLVTQAFRITFGSDYSDPTSLGSFPPMTFDGVIGVRRGFIATTGDLTIEPLYNTMVFWYDPRAVIGSEFVENGFCQLTQSGSTGPLSGNTTCYMFSSNSTILYNPQAIQIVGGTGFVTVATTNGFPGTLTFGTSPIGGPLSSLRVNFIVTTPNVARMVNLAFPDEQRYYLFHIPFGNLSPLPSTPFAWVRTLDGSTAPELFSRIGNG